MDGIRDMLRCFVNVVLPAFLAVAMLSTVACVTAGKQGTAGTGATAMEERKADVFRSDRYVVCLPTESTSAEILAGRYLGSRDRAWVIEEANGADTFGAGDAVVIPLRDENPGRLSGKGYQVVPILCYHRFAEECQDELCVSKEEFDRQIALLAGQGYHAISLGDLNEFLHYRRGLPEKSVVITIDDGYRSVYEIAYPILLKYGFTAAVFVYTDFISVGSKALTWDQLREMKASGFEVGSHTASHCDLTRPLEGESDQAYRTRVREELLISKQIIDEKLGQDTMALAFPYGNVTPAILHLCESLGYRLGMTVRSGSNPFFADPLALRRNQIQSTEGLPFEENLKTVESTILE